MTDEMPTPTAPASRRRFLRLAGAATAGVAATTLAAPEHAAAATGGTMLIGQSNYPTDVDDTTSLVNPSNAILMATTLRVANYSSGAYIPPTAHRTAVLGFTTGTDSRGGYRIGVHGRAENPTIAGATGVFGGTGAAAHPFQGSSIDIGVMGSSSGIGVAGHNDAGGVAVAGYSSSGVSLFAGSGGRLRLETQSAVGAPASGVHAAGEMIVDSTGHLYQCVVGGVPGTWQKVASMHPSYPAAGGSVNLLSKPIRLLDTRGTAGVPLTHGGAKIAANEQVVLQVTGTVAQGVEVPAGAVAVIGNLTAVQVNGTGWVTAWPSGPVPAVSNLNYNTGNATPAIANSFTCGLTAGGAMTVMCAQQAAHVVVDISGFIY